MITSKTISFRLTEYKSVEDLKNGILYVLENICNSTPCLAASNKVYNNYREEIIVEKYKTIYYPEVFIIHDHAKESYKRGDMLLIHTANMIKYFNKWGWFYDLKRIKTNQSILRKLNYER